MKQKKKLICIICPIGCQMEVLIDEADNLEVDGCKCKRGGEYARVECMNPVRTLTTTVKISGADLPLVSVKSSKPISKYLINECVKTLDSVKVHSPIRVGDIILENILDTGVDIVATRNI